MSSWVRFLLGCWLGCASLGAAGPTALAGRTAGEAGTVVRAAGASLYVERWGPDAGTPLVVVNGGPGFDHAYLHSSAAWEALAGRRPVVFYDQRGTGRSGPLAPGQSCTLADQIADLETVRQHLGAERIDLLGHSWGGLLAMAYAARHPERVRHLVLCDSAAPKWSDTVFLFDRVYPEVIERRQGRELADQMGDAAAAEENMHDYLSMLFYSAEHRDRFLAHAADYKYSRAVNRAVLADVARFDLNPELGKYPFPALVVTGRFDMNVAPFVAYHIHRSIPGSRLAIFERSGHLPFTEEPEEFVRLLEDFLGPP